jgi:phage tail-like protein
MTRVARTPPPPRPPHDPRRWRLDPRVGWRLAPRAPDWLGGAAHVDVAAGSGALTLPPAPGGIWSLTSADGSLAGLVPPAHVAWCAPRDLWLLDRARHRLRRFDPCTCRFEPVPCAGARALLGARAVTVTGRSLYVVGPDRVAVFALPDLALRGHLAPPAAAVTAPWQPVAVAVTAEAVVVADAGSGALHRFHRGGTWLGATAPVGAVEHLASDAAGRLYASFAGEDSVARLDAYGHIVERFDRREALADRFLPLPFEVLGGGQIDLTSLCQPPAARPAVFDLNGEPAGVATAPLPDAFVREASFLTSALDSRIVDCVWHRVVLHGELPPRTRLRMWTLTAAEALPDEVVAETPAHAWRAVPGLDRPGEGGELDALVRSARGRYLWLAGELGGDGVAAPCVEAMLLEYPRISLRRYLPAVFGADEAAADFTDRLLGIFDRGLRDIEAHIDGQHAWFDPRSAPASGADPARDFLGWLGGWLGIAVDRRWPEARRRRFLSEARHLYKLRGTRDGLRRQLLAYLGLPASASLCPEGSTGRPCPPCAPPRWQPPEMVLEEFQLRRWLTLGAGRLGDASRLWGERITGRTRLGGGNDREGRLGATRLDSTPDPRRDPFLVHANRLTVFVPASVARAPARRGAIEELIARETPAHVAWTVDYVEPRMRIGVQSMLGYDTVVGCYPEGIALGAAPLGRGTVLGPAPGAPDDARRLGRSRVGKSSKLT